MRQRPRRSRPSDIPRTPLIRQELAALSNCPTIPSSSYKGELVAAATSSAEMFGPAKLQGGARPREAAGARGTTRAFQTRRLSPARHRETLPESEALPSPAPSSRPLAFYVRIAERSSTDRAPPAPRSADLTVGPKTRPPRSAASPAARPHRLLRHRRGLLPAWMSSKMSKRRPPWLCTLETAESAIASARSRPLSTGMPSRGVRSRPCSRAWARVRALARLGGVVRVRALSHDCPSHPRAGMDAASAVYRAPHGRPSPGWGGRASDITILRTPARSPPVGGARRSP